MAARSKTMERFIWQTERWLAMPDMTSEIGQALEKIQSLRRRIFEFKKYPWFEDVQRDAFLNELVYSWEIEDVHLGLTEEKVLMAFTGQQDSFTGRCLNFVRSSDTLTPEAILRMHNELFPRLEKGFRTCSVGVGASEERLVYLAPPAEEVPKLLEELCHIHCDESADMHLRAAYSHIVVALIHPFSDGNGRAARLVAMRTVSDIFVDISKFIYLFRPRYYEELQKISICMNINNCLYFLLMKYCEAYHEMLRNLSNFEKYLMIHNIDFTNVDDMKNKISWDDANETQYALF